MLKQSLLKSYRKHKIHQLPAHRFSRSVLFRVLKLKVSRVSKGSLKGSKVRGATSILISRGKITNLKIDNTSSVRNNKAVFVNAAALNAESLQIARPIQFGIR